MVELSKDKKSLLWILTTTDKEGFHRCVYLTEEDKEELKRLLCEDQSKQ